MVPLLLAPENLILKEISGQKVKAKELLQYFKSYITVYSGDELPEPKSMLVVSVFLIIFLYAILFEYDYFQVYCVSLLLNLFVGNSRS